MTPIFKYILPSIMTLAACGNPVTLQKDLEREEERRRDSETQASQLSTQNEWLKSLLTHIYVSDNHLWVFAGIHSSYDNARSQCESIGYTIPNAEAFEEFKTQVLPRRTEWATMDTQPFHIEGQPSAAESGIVLCRTARQ